MFVRHLAKSSSRLSTSSTILRSFSTTATHCRTPALADVTPDGAATFDAKQKEFRQRVAEMSKRKDTSESMAVYCSLACPPTRTAALCFPRPSKKYTDIRRSVELGASGSSAGEDDGKRKGKLSSLIYGTKEGREMDKEMEHSFSQVLARGKYVHSIVFHEVKPDKVDEYIELVGNWYPRMAGMPENKVHLVGSWRTEVGDCDTFGEVFLLLPQ